jgi:hypothetical protein
LEPPVEGVVTLASVQRTDLNRMARFLTIDCHEAHRKSFPELWDPQWLTFGSERGCMIVGFEEVDGQRYYQGWYVQWQRNNTETQRHARGTD